MTSKHLLTELNTMLIPPFSQLKEIESLPKDHPSVPLLRDVIKEFRDDELEHLDMAVENFSQRAPAHAFLSSVIGAGCKVAIELCKRV
jgi:ubiquinone biosynthesis monooxygenase Coq7